MMRFLLLFLLITITSCGTPNVNKYYQQQKQQNVERYLDKLEPNGTPVTATIQMTIELVKDQGYLKKYYYPPTKQLISKTFYKDPLCKTADGPTTEWLDNGQLWIEGQHKDGKRVGEWRIYDLEKGYLSESGQYINNKKEGAWSFFNAKGTKVATYQFKNNVLDGPFEVYGEDGSIIRQGRYTKGELKENNALNSTIITGLIEELDYLPYLAYCENEDKFQQKKCSDHRISNEVYTKLRYPRYSRENGIEGQVLASFIVDKSGEIHDIKIHRGVNDDIREECIRVIKQMPPWKPGQRNGKAIEIRQKLPIVFRLQ